MRARCARQSWPWRPSAIDINKPSNKVRTESCRGRPPPGIDASTSATAAQRSRTASAVAKSIDVTSPEQSHDRFLVGDREHPDDVTQVLGMAEPTGGEQRRQPERIGLGEEPARTQASELEAGKIDPAGNRGDEPAGDVLARLGHPAGDKAGTGKARCCEKARLERAEHRGDPG